MRMSDQIKRDFDGVFLKVKKKGVEVSFSAELILDTLHSVGVSSFDSLDILYDLRTDLVIGISTKKILKRLNQLIIHYGYNDQSLIKAESTQPIIVEYQGVESELGFKVIKKIVRDQLTSYRYSSKVFRDLTDDFHRNLLALEKSRITQKEIERILPVSIRNIVGVNPFSIDRCVNDYQRVRKLKLSVEKTWIALPTEERFFILHSLMESAFRVILLSFNYIPGHVLNATMVQINELLALLSSQGSTTLSDDEVNMINASIVRLNALMKNPYDDSLLEYQGIDEELDAIKSVCDGLMSSSSILWIVGRDKLGRDLFSFSSQQHIKSDGRSPELISSAIYGIEAQLNEITGSAVQLLDQGVNSIVISSREKYTLTALVLKPIHHLVRQKLAELCDFVEDNLLDEINKFKGNVTPFQHLIGQYLKDNFSSIFVGAWE